MLISRSNALHALYCQLHCRPRFECYKYCLPARSFKGLPCRTQQKGSEQSLAAKRSEPLHCNTLQVKHPIIVVPKFHRRQRRSKLRGSEVTACPGLLVSVASMQNSKETTSGAARNSWMRRKDTNASTTPLITHGSELSGEISVLNSARLVNTYAHADIQILGGQWHDVLLLMDA